MDEFAAELTQDVETRLADPERKTGTIANWNPIVRWGSIRVETEDPSASNYRFEPANFVRLEVRK